MRGPTGCFAPGFAPRSSFDEMIVASCDLFLQLNAGVRLSSSRRMLGSDGHRLGLPLGPSCPACVRAPRRQRDVPPASKLGNVQFWCL